jgi:hypothetical protein
MTTKSRNLEVISDYSQSNQEVREKRKKPRIHLSSEQFRITQIGKLFSVIDLSTDGMAFRVLDNQDLNILPVGAVIEGTLNLRGEKYPIQVQVKHLAGQVIGCQFVDVAPGVRAALDQFLDPAELGRELKPIPSDHGVVWYHGPGGTDLLLSRAIDGRYHRFTLFVLGSYVQWEESSGATTGRALPSSERCDQRNEQWGVVQFETMVLDPDPQPDSDKLSIAKELILSSNIPQDLKKWCVRQMQLVQ